MLDGMAQGVSAFLGDGFWILWLIITAIVAFFAWLP